MSIFFVVFGLVMFVLLVVVHEWGHFRLARKNGVEVEEFGIGFPPKLWGKPIGKGKKKFLFTLNLLPFGGFVKLKGENDIDNRKGSYGAASLRAKIEIMVAGVFMNFLVAFGLLGFGSMIGLPQLVPDQFHIASDSQTVRQDVLVGWIEEGSPADEAGLEVQDRLITMGSDTDTLRIDRAEDVPVFTEERAGQEIVITYDRSGEVHEATAILRSQEVIDQAAKDGESIGHLGMAPSEYVVRRASWSAPIVAIGVLGQFTYMTLDGIVTALANLVSGNGSAAGDQVTGPVGIFMILRDGSLLGFEFIIMFIAVISLTLAIINILPIPALDGGRLFLTILFRAFKRPLTKDIEERVHGTGFMLLILLIVLITIVDIRRFF